MDEEKAAAYYDEMLRKGGGAAKLKQGLGYGASSSLSSSPATFLSFVKGDSHEENAAKLEKENRLSAVSDKLKGRCSKDDGANDGGRHKRRHGSRSPSCDREQEHFVRGRPRSGSRDREHVSRSERSRRRDRRSRSSSSDHRRSRLSPGTPDSRSSSGSHSRDRRSHRYDRKKQERSPTSRRTCRSPRQTSRRSRSVSPSGHHRPSHRDLGRNSRSSRRSPSPRAERSHRKRSDSRKDETRDSRKPDALDYAKLIPGFDDMTRAEKVREKMKLQLSDTVSKDKAKGIEADWERFVFNKNAPLDDDAKLDYFGDGTGARDDTGFLQNTGSTFLSTNTSQAKREAQIQAAHDAAIFGPPTGMSFAKMASEISQSKAAAVQSKEASSMNSLLSDQVLATQQGSWRERALKLKEQRAGNTVT